MAGKHKNKTSRPKPTDVSDYDDLYEIDGYDRLDLSVTWIDPDETWSAQIYVNNALDEIGLNEFVASGGFGGQVFLGSPTNHREYGLILRWTPDL